MKIINISVLVVILAGCIPEVPPIPSGAVCTPDGFVMRPSGINLDVVVEPVTQVMDYIYDETGAAMTCVFTY